MAGLAAAHRLRKLRPELEIAIYEKSRGVGGRVATRRYNGATFDHGAQYIKTPTPALESLLTSELEHGSLHKIVQPVWVFDQRGTITPGDLQLNAAAKWTYAEGITQLPKLLAKDFDIIYDEPVTRLIKTDTGWDLWSNGIELDPADAVLLTPPAPQTAEIIAASRLDPEAQAQLVAELEKAPYHPCLTITLGYPRRPRPRAFYALVNTDKAHPISWMAFEHLKPERKTAGQGVYIMQMAPDWSREHWANSLEALTPVAAELLTDLLKQTLVSPLWSNRQGWRYALPAGQASFEVLNGAVPSLFFAGDFTAGQGRVNLAIEEGWKAADLISRHVREAR